MREEMGLREAKSQLTVMKEAEENHNAAKKSLEQILSQVYWMEVKIANNRENFGKDTLQKLRSIQERVLLLSNTYGEQSTLIGEINVLFNDFSHTYGEGGKEECGEQICAGRLRQKIYQCMNLGENILGIQSGLIQDMRKLKASLDQGRRKRKNWKGTYSSLFGG